MTLKEIKELVKVIDETELSEFKLKKENFELTIKSKQTDATVQTVINPNPMVTMAQPVQQVASAPAPAAEKAVPAEPTEIDSSNLIEVKSPIIGTFYRSPSPDKPPYLTVGDNVNVGDVVCIVEAMKLFNEIESEVSGTIVKVLVEDASPVEYDTPLFLVDPKG